MFDTISICLFDFDLTWNFLYIDGRIISLDDTKRCNGYTGVNQCKFGPDQGCFPLCLAQYKHAIISAFCEESGAGTTQCRCTFDC